MKFYNSGTVVEPEIRDNSSVLPNNPDFNAQLAIDEYEAIRPYLNEILPEIEPYAWSLASMIGELFPSHERGPALAVSWCESRWGADVRAFDPEWPDAGWMQINRFWHEERAASAGFNWDKVRLDMSSNVEMAQAIWADSGWDAWTCKKVLPSNGW
jgi:hypothetical protein